MKNYHQQNQENKVIKILLEKEGFNLSSRLNSFTLSWDSRPQTQLVYKLKFSWKGVIFRLTAIGTYNLRSNTTIAILEFEEHFHRFGIGQSSIGAGSIGDKPDIIIGNHKLEVSFGKNHIHLYQKGVGSDLNNEEPFEFFL
jgi:hypothetical protein